MELTPDYPSRYAAITPVAKKLGIGTAETLRKWVRRAETDAGERPGTTSAEQPLDGDSSGVESRTAAVHLAVLVEQPTSNGRTSASAMA